MESLCFTPEQKVLVIGGTGATGQRVVRKLAALGCAVTVLTRNQEGAKTICPDGTQFIEGDIRSPSWFNQLSSFHQVVIGLGSRTFYGKNGIEQMEVQGIQNLMHGLTQHRSCKQIVLISAFGIGRTSPVLTLFSKLLNQYFHHKEVIEQLVIDSKIPFTIIRPVELLNGIPTGAVVLNQEAKLSLLRFVNRDDVAESVVQALLNDSAKNKIFEISGSLKAKVPLNWNHAFLALGENQRLRLGKTPL